MAASNKDRTVFIIKGCIVCLLGAIFPLCFPFLAELKPFAFVLLYRLRNGLAFLVCTILIVFCILSSQRKQHLQRKPTSSSQRRSFDSVFGDTSGSGSGSGNGISRAYMYLNSLEANMEPEPDLNQKSFSTTNLDDRSAPNSADLAQDGAEWKNSTGEEAKLESEAMAENLKVKCTENPPVEGNKCRLDANSSNKDVNSKSNVENLDVNSDAKLSNNLDVNSNAKHVELKSVEELSEKSSEKSPEKTLDKSVDKSLPKLEDMASEKPCEKSDNEISSVKFNGSLDKTRSEKPPQDNSVLEGHEVKKDVKMPSPILFNGDRSKLKKTVKRVSFNLREDKSNDSSDDGSSNGDHFSPVKSMEVNSGSKVFSSVKTVEISNGHSLNSVSTMTPSELDRQAGAFIARFKEQMRLQGLETTPSSRRSRSPVMKVVV